MSSSPSAPRPSLLDTPRPLRVFLRKAYDGFAATPKERDEYDSCSNASIGRTFAPATFDRGIAPDMTGAIEMESRAPREGSLVQDSSNGRVGGPPSVRLGEVS